ncbi:rhamnosyltransferase [Photobacterium phosphoreum]|uniref:rhamnosyltransferase n=1 Tax=Photobacterium phosphoreum TaxID=659 RepID=UPI000D157F3F|nr:rhamnosyltransferase [Photobacterium phosphoreum]PSW30383.1 rhamnosyltransferase [Photobacterium phosphoreum]
MIISVTVTYNPDCNCLEKQLQSLKNQISTSFVVDNGSSNIEQIEKLVNKFDYQLIKLDRNMGLSFAQNRGIEAAIRYGADYLLLLDQDSILNDNFVCEMKSVYDKYNVGVLGPSFYDPENNQYYPGTNYIGPFIKRTPISIITDVTYVIASGSFFSASVYRAVGKMEEDLFVDYIDVEWSLRAKSLGYKVAMTNTASMSHTIGDSRLNILGRKISVHSPMRRYFLVRNSFFMIRKSYIPTGYKIREVIFNFIRSLISLCVNEDRLLTMKMILSGIKDGLLGRFGPYHKNIK